MEALNRPKLAAFSNLFSLGTDIVNIMDPSAAEARKQCNVPRADELGKPYERKQDNASSQRCLIRTHRKQGIVRLGDHRQEKVNSDKVERSE